MAQLLIQIDPALLATHPGQVAGHVVTALDDSFPISDENRRTFAVISCPGVSVEDARATKRIDPAMIPVETHDRIAILRLKRDEVRAEAKAAAHAAAVPPSSSDLTTRELVERIASEAAAAIRRGDKKAVANLDAEQDRILAASRTAYRAVEDAALAPLPMPDPLIWTADELRAATVQP